MYKIFKIAEKRRVNLSLERMITKLPTFLHGKKVVIFHVSMIELRAPGTISQLMTIA